jgi:flagellar biogenesis protein FliO
MKLPRRPLAGLSFCVVLLAADAALADAPPAPTATAAQPHSGIPFKQETQATDTLAYQSLAGVVLAALAAFGIVLGLKRFGKFGGPLAKTRRLHTVEAIRLSRRSMLYVVEYQGQELLLAESEHGIQLVSTQSSPATPDPASSPVGESDHA